MKRRRFLSSMAAGAAAASLGGISGVAETRSNVIVILADDLGFSDLGCYGGEIKTPHLDSLASGGVRFSQFYNTARCCPTRASLLTGLYPHQAGVGGMDNDEGVPSYQGYLNDRCLTIAEALKPAGYRTYCSGKWHVGRDKGRWPLDRGFDRYFGLIEGASNFYNNINYRNPETFQTILLDNEKYDFEFTTEEMWKRNEGFYMTDAFTDFAIDFINEGQSADPFFLYLPYTAPHWPLHAFPEDYEPYLELYQAGWDRLRAERLERQLEMGLFEPGIRMASLSDKVPDWKDAPEAMREEFVLEMALYAGMITRMDANIGRVIDTLKQNGEFDNTLIMFVSDNGGCHTTPSFEWLQGAPGGPASFPCYGFMGAELSNTPFRKHKQFIHEGGIATPFIAHGPGVDSGGRWEHQPGHVIDIMPTVIDAGGADYPETRNGNEIIPLQGVSMAPAFHGETVSREAPIFWEHVRNKGLRDGDWKLVAAKPDLEWELYDLAEDRTEQSDLSEEFPEKRADLIETWEAWARENRVKPFHESE